MIKVCEAVDHTQRKGKLVRRDLKPDHILFDEDGQPHIADSN